MEAIGAIIIVFVVLAVIFANFDSKKKEVVPKPISPLPSPKSEEKVMNLKHKELLKYVIENFDSRLDQYGGYSGLRHVFENLNSEKNPNITSIILQQYNTTRLDGTQDYFKYTYNATVYIKIREKLEFSEVLDLTKATTEDHKTQLTYEYNEARRKHDNEEYYKSTSSFNIPFIDNEISQLFEQRLTDKKIKEHNEKLRVQEEAINNFLGETHGYNN